MGEATPQDLADRLEKALAVRRAGDQKWVYPTVLVRSYMLADDEVEAALASLRSLAPAPAENINRNEISGAEIGEALRTACSYTEVGAGDGGTFIVSAPTPATMRKALQQFLERRVVTPAPADQSDAARDGVIEEWNKLAHDFVCHAVNSWQWLSNAHTGIAKPGAADVLSVHNDLHSLMDRWVELRQRGTPFERALASAPSETVGRGEDK